MTLVTPNALYIDGEWLRTAASEAVINPADESLIAYAPVGSVADMPRPSLPHAPRSIPGHGRACRRPPAKPS